MIQEQVERISLGPGETVNHMARLLSDCDDFCTCGFSGKQWMMHHVVTMQTVAGLPVRLREGMGQGSGPGPSLVGSASPGA
jgi:hypothetical protein